MSEKTYYIAWNADKSEGFITDIKRDAKEAVDGKRRAPYSATLGLAFRECYDEGAELQAVRLVNVVGGV